MTIGASKLKSFLDFKMLRRWYKKVLKNQKIPRDILRQKKRTLKETNSKDKAALYMLYRAVDESIIEKIVSASTSKEA